ncbi:MAG: glycine C-acetyltransferase [Rhodobacteraceae bacterium]|nr:glycine C-acetyltransferase [Paracoccaceae bacterium]
MTTAFHEHLKQVLTDISDAGLYKTERAISGPQRGYVTVGDTAFLNLCANNYLGLADDERLEHAAKNAIDDFGYGMASVRFICGTQTLHRELENDLAQFLGMDDSILFAACFDANGGLFEPLLGPEDAIISDALNHASIIDGIRLCKAKRYRYANANMEDLRLKLSQARADGARFVMIATDGVFSMDGTLAPLAEIRALADEFDALVMVDDCHATGFMGATGAGTPEHVGIKVDVLTGTLGKALGGAIGGYIAASQPVVDLLRQRARPYLFSNALPPVVCAAGIEALNIVREGHDLRARLFENATFWRAGLKRLGFELLPGEHPIVPVMIGEARQAQEMATRLFELGVYVAGFFYPVVPHGMARIRTQMNASLTKGDLERGLAAFEQAGRDTGVL